MTKILVHGLGRLGSSITLLPQDEFIVAAAVKSTQTANNYNFPIFYNLDDINIDFDIIIDCSQASAVDSIIKFAINKQKPIIICTTALYESTKNLIKQAAKTIPVLESANMSLGINLIVKLVKIAAAALQDSNFDIEITEKHHNKKIDAPSGTAVLLKNSITSIINNLEPVYDRSNKLERRKLHEIGIQSIRGGNIIGDHTVLFAGQDETIEISHNAISRDVFARGAIKAAKFISTKPAGLYSMNDLL